MSQERWDVVLRFLKGPLAIQGDMVLRGPVVRLGANPGPGGLKLDGYRGLDDRQAVITAYDGGTVSVAPVGVNQVRVNTHENVEWAEIQPLRGPVMLSPGDVVHLGPPNRGATLMVVEARRLGTWEQRRILSDAAQVDPELRPSEVRQLDTRKGMPAWFIPSLLGMAMVTVVTVWAGLSDSIQKEVALLGPVVDGEDYYARVDINDPELQLEPTQFAGFEQAIEAFVMRPNAKAAEWDELASNQKLWDDRYILYTRSSVVAHARANNFWRRLKEIEEEYRFVVESLKKAGLPDVLAAIPYQESQYRSAVNSPVCARGWWQLMPEVAHRVNVEVKNCKMAGSEALWSPKRVIPVRGVIKNAEYVSHPGGGYACRLGSCEVDQRTDLAESTRGSIELLKEAFDDEELRASGALVQIVILSHNSGYDNSRFEEKQVNAINMLAAYRRHLKKTAEAGGKALERDPSFYGKNITCTSEEHKDIVGKGNDTCGGVIANQSQHYAYSITAQHMLAACFYALNYGEQSVWKDYYDQFYGDGGYCQTLQIPKLDNLGQ